MVGVGGASSKAFPCSRGDPLEPGPDVALPVVELDSESDEVLPRPKPNGPLLGGSLPGGQPASLGFGSFRRDPWLALVRMPLGTGMSADSPAAALCRARLTDPPGLFSPFMALPGPVCGACGSLEPDSIASRLVKSHSY